MEMHGIGSNEFATGIGIYFKCFFIIFMLLRHGSTDIPRNDPGVLPKGRAEFPLRRFRQTAGFELLFLFEV